MSKKANPTVIGLFVVTGLALGVTGLIVFSSGNFFSKKDNFIMYFQGSMKGMNVGAPVQYRGVTVGKVVKVYVAHHQADDDMSMPVVAELDESLLKERTDRRIVDLHTKLKDMAARGLRARMDAASLITGVLQVQLELVPDAPPPVYHQIGDEYPEIPTAPTSIEMLLSNLAKFDIQAVGDRIESILTHLDTSLSNLDVKSINTGVTNLLASLNVTIGNFGALAKNVDTNTLVQVQATLADLRTTIQGLSVMTAPDSPVQTELAGALEQLSNAGRSLTELTEFLKRNPNALITGRTPPKEKP